MNTDKIINLIAELSKNEHITPNFMDSYIENVLPPCKNEDLYHGDSKTLERLLDTSDDFFLSVVDKDYVIFPVHQEQAKHWTLCVMSGDDNTQENVNIAFLVIINPL